MARIARKNLDAMYYHVMVQGINKEYIFEKDECKKIYIKLLKKWEKGTEEKSHLWEKGTDLCGLILNSLKIQKNILTNKMRFSNIYTNKDWDEVF